MRRLIAFAAMLLLAAMPHFATAVTLTDNGDGTVTDAAHGLVWMRCSLGQTWTGTGCSPELTEPYVGAYALETYLTEQTVTTFAGRSDWRLPTLDELQYIVDLSQSGLKLDPVAFPNSPTLAPYWWSSSVNIDDQHGGHHYWAIDFSRGIVGDIDWASTLRIRLVAPVLAVGSVPLTVSKSGNGAGTVSSTPAGIDNCTGNCSATFAVGTDVTLTAVAASGSIFTGWSGACSGTGTCNVHIDAAKSVVATFSADGSVTFGMKAGWNLLGNSQTQTLEVASLLGDPELVTTVWKWDATAAGWAFYTPAMDAAALQAYAASKGYAVLVHIHPGEGFWVNAKQAATLPKLSGSLFSLTAAGLKSGWNLVATGDDVTPSTFNMSLSATPPTGGTIPLNFTTLWAWDSQLSMWYFYAPSLAANQTLADYIVSKNYLNFFLLEKTLGKGTGFWVNRP